MFVHYSCSESEERECRGKWNRKGERGRIERTRKNKRESERSESEAREKNLKISTIKFN